VRNQFFERWNDFAKNHMFEARYYRPLIEQIRADSIYVANTVMSRYQKETAPHVACDLSGQKPGDRILIVAGFSQRESRMSMSTLNMLRVFESKQKGTKDFITLTHPDPEILSKIEAALQEQKNKNIIRSGVAVHPFEMFAQDIETHHQVYVDLQMGLDPEADNEMIHGWAGRVGTHQKLTHMRGIKDEPRASSPAWKAMEADGIILPEAIAAEIEKRKENNVKIENAARSLTKTCAEMRLGGLVPSQIFALGHAETAPENLPE
jgi:hypothetical protein